MAIQTDVETGRFNRGAWLVYINGLEIPCPEVSISYGVWGIPEATLSFSPHRLLQRLGNEDRVEVVVFYLDTTYQPERPQFRILFEGEILGWSYTSMRGQRMMSFNAIADISILTQLNFSFLNTADAAVSALAIPGATANSIPQGGAFYPFSLFKKGLLYPVNTKSSDAGADITRPFELLYNIVRGVVQANIPDIQRTIPATNFFARWIRKRNFINRFVALPLFEDEQGDATKGVFPIFKAVQGEFALKAMSQDLTATIGDSGSLFSVLQFLLDKVYFELVMLPTAPCVRARLSDGTILRPGSEASTSAETENTEPVRLANYFVKPRTMFGIAPTCNVFFPSLLATYTYAENYAVQPTRTYINEGFVQGMLGPGQLVASQLTFGYPEEINAAVRVRAKGNEKTAINPAVNGKNVLVFPEEFFKGIVQNRLQVPEWFTILKNQVKRDDEAQAKSLQELMASYVKYEHFRKRYEARGGSLQLAWNPYVVPGFPCVVFDRRSEALDTLGYVGTVQHTLSATGGMATNVNYTSGRTFQEMFDLLAQDMLVADKILGAAPAEPIESIRDVIQDFDQAEQFYNALFFARRETPGKKASFDFREVVEYDNGEAIYVDGVEPAQSAVNYTIPEGDLAFSSQGSPKEGHNLDGSRDIRPTAAFKDVFENYSSAMEYVSRPICTLDEYITFIHGGRPLADLEAEQDGVPPQVVRLSPDANPYGYAATELNTDVTAMYERIKRLRQGPGPTPSPAELGAFSRNPDTGEITPFVGEPSGYKGTAQTRADWNSALEAYRQEIYDRLAPQE